MDNKEIQRVTTDYWDKFKPEQIDKAMRFYVCEPQQRLREQSLLEAELAHARQRDCLPTQTCETLVLLVGFSLEPLLQSISAYKPKNIVLLLNQDGYLNEEWYVFADHMFTAVNYLVDKELLAELPQFLGEEDQKGYPVFDNPTDVFQILVEVLHDKRDVVIDITGGKKSMVSGAYLYAAYAGARISYVDFDEYDPKYRRPYGYSCKIGELTNPYERFALRDWERVHALYERYQFREARNILQQDILPTMKEVLPDSEQAIQCLMDFLQYYEKWDQGDYRDAKRDAERLPSFDQPSAVERLGEQWFEMADNQFNKKPYHFYGDLDAVKVYVADELARIRRLIDYSEDYRSAILRAGSVNEIIMLARIVHLLTDPSDRASLLTPLDKRTPNAQKVFEALVDKDKSCIDVQNDIRFKNAPNLQISRPQAMNPWWQNTDSSNIFNQENGWKLFLNLRNELTHKYFSPPRKWAEDALAFVRANAEDFFGKGWEAEFKTEALPWSQLCKLCGIDRFLPPNLRKEA